MVTDQSNLAIGGAVVTARWTYPDGMTATQNAFTTRAGKATFNTQGPPGTYRLSVRNIAKQGYVFDAAHSVLTQTAGIQ
jgi:hypothetical protein